MKKNDFYILICIIAVMLFAGLWPFTFTFPNKAVIEGKNNIRFFSPSFAYDEKPFSPGEERFLADSNYTLTMRMGSPKNQARSIARIITMVNGDIEHIVIGQWKSHLVISTVERHPQKYKQYKRELTVLNVFADSLPFELACVQTREKISVYVNGILKCTGYGQALFGSFPSGKNRFLFGCTQHGKFGFTGELGDVAITRGNSTKSQFIGFLIGQNDGETVHRLVVPKQFPLFLKPVLALPWHDFTNEASYWADIAVNLLGFMPFGFFIAIAISAKGSSKVFWGNKRIVIYTTVLGFGISLFIELTQVFMPFRTSQLSDLIMNTLGTMIGALLRSASVKQVPDSRYKAAAESK